MQLISKRQAERKPICWLSYANMPNPDPYGWGCPAGYARRGWLDTEKPQWPVAEGVQLSCAIVEHEDGALPTGKIHFTDPRTPGYSKAELLNVVAPALKGTRLRLDKTGNSGAFLWFYRLAKFYWGDDAKRHAWAVEQQILTGAFEHADGFVIDAHRPHGMPLSDWERLLDQEAKNLSAVTKKPLCGLVSDQFHPNSGGGFVPQDEAVAMFRYAWNHPLLRTVARYGGDQGKGSEWRQPFRSNPAEQAITSVFTGG